MHFVWNLLPSYLLQDKLGLIIETPPPPKKAKMEEKFLLPYHSFFSYSLNMPYVLYSLGESGNLPQVARIDGMTRIEHTVSSEAIREVRKESWSSQRRD